MKIKIMDAFGGESGIQITNVSSFFERKDNNITIKGILSRKTHTKLYGIEPKIMCYIYDKYDRLVISKEGINNGMLQLNKSVSFEVSISSINQYIAWTDIGEITISIIFSPFMRRV